MQKTLPGWINYGVLPGLNILVAFLVSALLFWYIDIPPLEALSTMWEGAFSTSEGVGYTLYYATGFVFTGLAVAVAFHAQLFNIGGEGQAYLGGLGAVIVALWLGPYLPFWLMLPLIILFAMAFGAGWAAVPAYLQAKRGSHIVITTIMFNFISASLMAYLLVQVFKPETSMIPESAVISASSQLPKMHTIMQFFGFEFDSSPWNLSFVFALLACLLVWLFIWKTPAGYEIRAFGHNPTAANYAGISATKAVMVAMCLSGALAGLFAINVVNGELHQLKLNFVEGFGFTGIAVALMGRSHPVGVLLASILFGFLYQGGAELAFWYENVDRNIVVVLQGLIILFSGALEHMFRPQVQALYNKFAGDTQNG